MNSNSIIEITHRYLHVFSSFFATKQAAVQLRGANEDIKVQEVVILDLSKNLNDQQGRLQHCHAQYEIVKSQRNKYAHSLFCFVKLSLCELS